MLVYIPENSDPPYKMAAKKTLTFGSCTPCRTCHTGFRKRNFTTRLLLLCTVFSIAVRCSWGQNLESNDIQTLLSNLDNARHRVVNEAKFGMKLPDATAIVGKIFHYPLQDYTAGIAKFVAQEVGKTTLPEWLAFDDGTLKGVASGNDTKHTFIEVKASNGRGDITKDVFTIHVKPESKHGSVSSPNAAISKAHSLNLIKCQKKQPVTTVTVVVDADYRRMKPLEKVKLLQNMMTHLDLGADVLQLLPVNDRPLLDASALVAGPGDVRQPKHEGTFITWKVGCGNVNPNHMPVLEKLERTSPSGKMARDLGYSVIGYHVTSRNPTTHKRLRRQARYTATPGIATPPPTKMATETSTPTEAAATTTESEDIMTRTVPSMSSPVMPSHSKTRTKTTKTTDIPSQKSQVMPTLPATPVVSTMTVTTPDPDKVHTVVQPATMEPGRTTPTATVVVPIRPPTIEPSAVQPSAAMPSATEKLPTPTPAIEIPVVSKEVKPTKVVVVTEPTKLTTVMTKPLKPHVTTPEIVIVPVTKEPKPTKSRKTKKPIPRKTTPTPKPTKFPPKYVTVAPTPASTTAANYKPSIKNRIKPIEAKLGSVLKFRIPADTFIDSEDGNTRHLKLMFQEHDGTMVRRTSWIRFDQKTQTLYGLPFLPNHVKTHTYVIIAIDSKSAISQTTFQVKVIDDSDDYGSKMTHEFGVTFKMNYEKFIHNVEYPLNFSKNLASYFGDEEPGSLKITSIKKGSVKIGWTNTTLNDPTQPCPVHAISALFRYLASAQNGTYVVNPAFIAAMAPLKVSKVGVAPAGNCDEKFAQKDVVQRSPPDRSEQPQEDDDTLKVIVIPLVAIAGLLLLAGVIACCLYRKKRKGKLSDEDHHTFINKGIPVIFADELDEKLDPPTRPLIMEDEKPPQSAPDYQRSSASGSTPSTPPSDHKPLDETEDDDEQDASTAPLYQPPPPVYPSKDGNQQTRTVNNKTYRSPPAYVPP